MRLRLPELGELVDSRTARKGQADTLADLVEDLSHGVITRLRQSIDSITAALDSEKEGVTPRDDKTDEVLRNRIRHQTLAPQKG